MSNTEQSYQVQSHVKKGCVEQVNDGVVTSGDGVTKIFRTRFFYNSAVHPAKIDAVLASDFRRNNVKSHKNLKIDPRVFRASTRSSNQNHSSNKLNTCVSNCNVIEVCKTASTDDTGVVSRVYTASDSSIGVHQVGSPSRPCSVKTTKSIEPFSPDDKNQTCLLYDRRLNGIDDKFINSILYNVGCNNGPQKQIPTFLNNGKSNQNLHSALSHIVNRLCQMWLILRLQCPCLLLKSMLSFEPLVNITTWVREYL